MWTAYGLLKTVHVLGAVVWIGGVAALWTTAIRLGRSGDRAALGAILGAVRGFGQRVAGPASGLVLLSGIAMAILARLGGQLWIWLGMGGVVLHLVLSFTLLRARWTAVGKLLGDPAGDAARLAVAVREVTVAAWIYLAVMAATIAVMVLKPTLGA